jgi:hypothetical protein
MPSWCVAQLKKHTDNFIFLPLPYLRLIPWSGALHKPAVAQLVKKLPVFYRTKWLSFFESFQFKTMMCSFLIVPMRAPYHVRTVIASLRLYGYESFCFLSCAFLMSALIKHRLEIQIAI